MKTKDGIDLYSGRYGGRIFMGRRTEYFKTSSLAMQWTSKLCFPFSYPEID
jgi:hypothetical protein